MKIVLALCLTVAAFAALHIPVKGPYKNKKNGIILVLYAMGMVLFFVVYNIRTVHLILPFYRPTLQSMYQMGFLAEGEYPDAFLTEFFKGKTVYTPNDAFDVSDDFDLSSDENDYDEHGNYWIYDYYHAVNMWDFLDFAKASVVKDDSLTGVRLSDEQKAYFEDLGAANDMMRYTFALTPYNGEWGNGFYYYWFYNYFIGDSRVYMCTEEISDAKELVVLWQQTEEHDTDSFYIASKQYFDEVITK
ncbi:MAG: hypothetical protein K6G67_08755 [Lachnospiraceae bacterium]|nr:hypothetical protein [Lachnospiraceae bacterium]